MAGNLEKPRERHRRKFLTDAVKQGLQAKAGKGKLGKIESLTEGGKLVAYEAKVTTGTKKSEVQVGPDGKPLAHEE